MKKTMLAIAGILAAASSAATASGLGSAGPRVGIVYQTNPKVRQDLNAYMKSKNESAKATDMLTAIGWQFEYEYMNTDAGTSGLVEFVPLVLGLDAGLLVPSINVLFGVRFANGLEFGWGPNVATGTTKVVNEETGAESYKVKAGVGMVFAVGETLKVGQMNFPINLALVKSETGSTVSALVGWTL